jgi:hypothetical protein
VVKELGSVIRVFHRLPERWLQQMQSVEVLPPLHLKVCRPHKVSQRQQGSPVLDPLEVVRELVVIALACLLRAA